MQRLNKSQSMKSVRSNKSMKAMFYQESDTYLFDDLVAASVEKYCCPYRTVVKKDYQLLDEFLKSLKQSNRFKSTAASGRSINSNLLTLSQKDVKIVESENINSIDDDIIVITAIYNNANKLCEILLHNLKFLPRDTMQIIGVIAPYFTRLTKLSIKRCRISAYTIYDMSKFLPLTSITEICLDESPLRGSNYKLLLDKPCRITSLSLCRCQINDEHCVQIASMLHYSEPAEATLTTLNLSSNHITDVGARSIGEALRSNRHLRYLNIADNRISDDGADRILHTLIDFTLSDDEILSKHQNYFEHLKLKGETYMKCRRDWDAKSVDNVTLNMSTESRPRCKKSTQIYSKGKEIISVAMDDASMHNKSENTKNETVGQFSNSFTAYFTNIIDGHSHCIGNMVLCYLDLSYNSLSYLTVKKLCSVLIYQNSHKKPGQTGLLKVVIDGNPAPIYCNELEDIGYFLQKNVINFSPRHLVSDRTIRKSRAGKISVIQEKHSN